MRKRSTIAVLIAIHILSFIFATTSLAASKPKWPRPTPSPTATPTPTPAPTASATPSPTATPSQKVALVYNGFGANASNVAAVLEILRANGLAYKTADHNALNGMPLSTLAGYSIIIVPGGNSIDMDNAITAEARFRVKQAVRTYGVSYTGFCAGAWMVVGPSQSSGVPVWGFGILSGDYLKQYYPNGQNPESAVFPNYFATGATRSLVWYRGPVLPNISGGVIAKHPDGSPSIVGTWAGNGYVTMTGPHPEAPQSWRYGLNDPDGIDYDIAWSVIKSALDRQKLATF